MNKWVDLKRAAKITGSRFYFLKGDLARLEFASSSMRWIFCDSDPTPLSSRR